MPQQVDIPNVGPVEFPDGMSQEEMTAAIERNYPGQLRAARKPEDVSAGMALRGIPVLGAYVPQAEAAIRAAAQPLTGVGQPGASWSERYAANLPEREAQYTQAEHESPITSEALKAGGYFAALAPVGATAAGARALGATGNIASRIGMGAASGAGLSAADVAARGGSAEDIQSAAKLGAGVGAAAPVIGAGVRRVFSPVTPTADPVYRGAVQTLQREGADLTAGVATGSKPLQWAEQHLGELGGIDVTQRTREQFTRAALRRVGENATRATPEVIDRAFSRIGQQFDDLAARNTLVPDGGMGPQIRHAIADYDRLISPPHRAPALTQYEQEIATALGQNRGTLPGDVYQSIRSRMETDARNTNDGTLANALRGMRGALDDAMERYLTRTNSPDVGAWQQARNQYRNLLVLERAVTSSGTKLGEISPAALFQATKNVQGTRNLARGRGDYADLAQAGSDILTRLPSSGTAQRSYMQGIPAAIGATLGGMTGNPMHALAGGAAGILGPPLAGRAIMHPWMQQYLQNQAMTGRAGQALQGGVSGGLLSMMQ